MTEENMASEEETEDQNYEIGQNEVRFQLDAKKAFCNVTVESIIQRGNLIVESVIKRGVTSLSLNVLKYKQGRHLSWMPYSEF